MTETHPASQSKNLRQPWKEMDASRAQDVDADKATWMEWMVVHDKEFTSCIQAQVKMNMVM